MATNAIDAGVTGGLPLSVLWTFALTVGLSFLLGLELHRYLRTEGAGLGFGTARTLTLIGATGFLLGLVGTNGVPFAVGLAALALWLALYYRERLRGGEGGLLVPLIAMLAYLLGPLATRTPFWFPVLVTALVLILLSEKPRIRHFEDWLPEGEIATAVKFVVMAGIVLPLLPDHPIASFIPVTYRATWLAVVAVSGISYLGYLAQTYVVPRRGLQVAGVLGGLYSSTATTFVIAERARVMPAAGPVSAALMLATAMMYVRLMVLSLLLAPALVGRLAIPLGAGALLSLAAAGFIALRLRGAVQAQEMHKPAHPLELKTAVVFATLFVLFATVTQLVVSHYGAAGVKTLSLVVGFTDIDPFVLSLFGGHFAITPHLIVAAVTIATGSNNVLKALYALGVARNSSVVPAVAGLGLLAGISFAVAFAGILP